MKMNWCGYSSTKSTLFVLFLIKINLTFESAFFHSRRGATDKVDVGNIINDTSTSPSNISEETIALDSNIRGNLALGSTVSASSVLPIGVLLTNGKPDWTYLARDRAIDMRNLALSFYKSAPGDLQKTDNDNCVFVINERQPEARPWIIIDLAAIHSIGFVRVYDGIDPEIHKFQKVTVVASKTNPHTLKNLLLEMRKQASQDSTVKNNVNQQSKHFQCGGILNISGWGQPVDIPCFSEARFVTIIGESSILRLCSVEVQEVNHMPS